MTYIENFYSKIEPTMITKNNLLWVCLLLFTGTSLSSQELSTPVGITQSEIFRDKKRTSALLFAENVGNDELFMLRTYSMGFLGNSSESHWMEYYDSDLNLIRESELIIGNNILFDLIVWDDQVILLEKSESKTFRKLEYFAIRVDLNDMSVHRQHLISAPKPGPDEAHIFTKSNHDERNNTESDLPRFSHSSIDRDFILLELPARNNDSLGNRIVLFDRNFEKVLDQTFFNDPGREFVPNNIALDEQNRTIYLLGKLFPSESTNNLVREGVNYIHSLYRVDEEGITSTSFNAGNKLVNNLVMMLNPQGLFFVGPYSEQANSDYTGIAYFKLDPESLTIEVTQLNPFPEQFLKETYGNRRGARRANRGSGIPLMNCRDFFLDGEGNIYFNAEEYYYKERWYESHNHKKAVPINLTTRYRGSNINYYNDIYAGKINSSGELEWMRTIKKKQNTKRADQEFLSYTSTFVDGKMYLFFNARKRVRKMRNDRNLFRPVKERRLNLYMVEIDSDGSWDYRRLVEHKDSRISYMVNPSALSSTGETIFLYGHRRKNKQILKLELK
jgi:hypothetical protein